MMQISFHWKFLSKPEQITQTFQNKAKLDSEAETMSVQIETSILNLSVVWHILGLMEYLCFLTV